eukprot:1694807-Rhodomonas_salina.4
MWWSQGRPQVRSPRGLERSDTNTDLASSVKEFVGKFASAGMLALMLAAAPFMATRLTVLAVQVSWTFVVAGARIAKLKPKWARRGGMSGWGSKTWCGYWRRWK